MLEYSKMQSEFSKFTIIIQAFSVKTPTAIAHRGREAFVLQRAIGGLLIVIAALISSVYSIIDSKQIPSVYLISAG